MPNPKARLLIVDDDPLVCKSMSTIFTVLGYATRTAPNGFSALNAIRDEAPDIILSDLNMPGMSGFELLSVVRRRFPSIRVVAMSGAFEGKSIPAGVAADAFYEKGSHRPHLLLAAIEAMTRPQESQPAHFPARSDAPIWIPTNGHDPSGEPYVTISCPECLRTFPQVLDKNARSALNTTCAHCSNSIQYAIVHSMDPLPTAARQ
jgi:CheY-like chemotaxis protein